MCFSRAIHLASPGARGSADKSLQAGVGSGISDGGLLGADGAGPWWLEVLLYGSSSLARGFSTDSPASLLDRMRVKVGWAGLSLRW